jgi:hypothetical protein
MKTLRKGFGCYYAQRESAHVLQKLMRHADIKTTLRYYVNFDNAVEAAVQARKGMHLDNKTPPLCNVTCSNRPPDKDAAEAFIDTTPGGQTT